MKPIKKPRKINKNQSKWIYNVSGRLQLRLPLFVFAVFVAFAFFSAQRTGSPKVRRAWRGWAQFSLTITLLHRAPNPSQCHTHTHSLLSHYYTIFLPISKAQECARPRGNKKNINENKNNKNKKWRWDKLAWLGWNWDKTLTVLMSMTTTTTTVKVKNSESLISECCCCW